MPISVIQRTRAIGFLAVAWAGVSGNFEQRSRSITPEQSRHLVQISINYRHCERSEAIHFAVLTRFLNANRFPLRLKTLPSGALRFLLGADGASGSSPRNVQCCGGANERLQRLFIDLVALVEIDGTPGVAFEAGVEEA